MALHCRFSLISLLAAGFFLAGCKDNKIISYRVPKEPAANAASRADSAPPSVAGAAAQAALPPGHPAIAGMPMAADAGNTMASTPVPTATGQPLVWTAPAAWTVTQGSSMRKGSYSVSGPEGSADISILAFPGDVGGDLANVNRWLGQLQLPPVADAGSALRPIDSNGLHMLVFEGANLGSRMIGVIVPYSGATWFFKITGPDALVAREKPVFLDFLKTVKIP
jgi:hypothetical protein